MDCGAPKRFFDLVVASILLIALLPVFILIALAIALDSPGPVFYVHSRVGYLGRCFQMLKFRTMQRDRRVRAVPISFPDRRRSLKVRNDPRITRVGRVLRRTSLDELPQLMHIMHGDMTFVGPRPELPELVARYNRRTICGTPWCRASRVGGRSMGDAHVRTGVLRKKTSQSNWLMTCTTWSTDLWVST